MSSAPRDDPHPEPSPELTSRLGYLLKHAQLRLNELTNAALAPYGLLGRDLAVLLVLNGGGPASQQEAAGRLGVDRTTMVALLDALEAKQLVARHPAADDRRRNVVELTEHGRETLRAAVEASDQAERAFLACVSPTDARVLKQSLRTAVQGD